MAIMLIPATEKLQKSLGRKKVEKGKEIKICYWYLNTFIVTRMLL